jgi:hypothetical protein
VLNSLKYSAREEQEKEKPLDYFNKRWRKFVEQAPHWKIPKTNEPTHNP